jgi:hypothetical protein
MPHLNLHIKPAVTITPQLSIAGIEHLGAMVGYYRLYDIH